MEKTIQDYRNLKKQLVTISKQHQEKYDFSANGYLDACYIQVVPCGLGNWRTKKEYGCEKRYSEWIFFKTSTNSNGGELYDKIENAVSDFKLYATERQL
tara:strand:+ start:116 stop:412 length:297 start_codon:yes stop_codon:yes gene_type:complete